MRGAVPPCVEWLFLRTKKAIIFKDIFILIKFAWLTQEYYENWCRNHGVMPILYELMPVRHKNMQQTAIRADDIFMKDIYFQNRDGKWMRYEMGISKSKDFGHVRILYFHFNLN